MNKSKVCNACGRRRSASRFNTRTCDGHRYLRTCCKDCDNAKRKGYYWRELAKERKYYRQYYRVRRGLPKARIEQLEGLYSMRDR